MPLICYKGWQLMMLRSIISVYSQNQKTPINTLCGPHTESLDVRNAVYMYYK